MNVNSGRAVWKFATDGAIQSSPLVANEMIYFGTEKGSFYGLDFRGTLKWRFQAKRAMTSSPILKGQSIYTASLDGTLYALDAKSGWAIWKFRLGKGTV